MSGGHHQFNGRARSAERVFGATPEAASDARRYADGVLRSWDVVLHSDALLLVAELAANAVRHAGTRFVLSLRLEAGLLLVAVSDTDPAPPQLAEPGPTATGGRGLVIVAALADSWGWRPSSGGKTVWAAVSALTA